MSLILIEGVFLYELSVSDNMHSRCRPDSLYGSVRHRKLGFADENLIRRQLDERNLSEQYTFRVRFSLFKYI